MGPGHVVDDRFEIERMAGEGGMGKVYRAVDRRSGAAVALKVLGSKEPVDTRRFDREARVLSALELPGVVGYIDHGTTASGQVWMAMEWLDGETLAERARRDPLVLSDAIRAVRSAALAIAPLHAQGIVHRDLKPSNLFIIGGDLRRVKVIDFGIARSRITGHTLTTTGQVMGTAFYMSPEQARGDREIDARTDVYALGCVLYELLVGRPPFTGANLMAVLAKILLDAPPRVRDARPEVPDDLDELVDRSLAKEPEVRPPDATALERALAELGALPIRAASIAPSRPPPVLTSHEQRLLCVVMTAGAKDRISTAPTLITTTPGTPLDLRGVVESQGGRLEILADGSLVATVSGAGAPTDHAARAARVALSMRDLLPDLPMVLVAGRGLITARFPVGDVIDRGALVLEAGFTGIEEVRPIRIDHVMAGLLDGRFDIGGDAAGLFLRGVRTTEEPLRTLLGREVPCVGREREIAALEALVDEAIGEPVARAVLVTAPPGGGKSRVCRELLQRLDEREGRVEVLVGRGDPMRAGAPFALLGEAVRRAAGIQDGEPVEVRRTKLEARLARHLSPDELARPRLFIGELARCPYPDETHEPLRAARQDAGLMGDAMRAAFRAWLAAECTADPVLFVLEDLHWGDLPTVRFIDDALRALADRPFVVVALARPEVKEMFPDLWAERDLQEVRLARLTRRAAEKLVRSALGDDVPEETVTQIVDRADGNAFFLEELVRAVAAGGGAVMPDSVIGMVQARLDSLGPESRRVLRAASIFGQTFWEGGVAALVGPEVPVEITLHELSAHELVARNATTAFPGQGEWGFRHALVREAAYAMLTEEDGRLGHRLAGEWLEKVGSSDALVMAEHLRRGGAKERACHFYRIAAEQALEANDYAAALARAELGIETDPAVPALGQLRLVQAEAHRWRGEYEQALGRAVEAAGAIPRGGARWFTAVGDVLVSAGQLGQRGDIDRWVDEARRAQGDGDGRDAQLVCLCRGAYQYLAAGQYEVADRIIEQVTRLSKDLDRSNPVTAAWIHTTRASRALHAGDLGAYLAGTEAAVRAYERAGDLRHACNQRVRLGYGYVEIGDYPRAEEVLRAARDAADKMGLRVIASYAMQNLGYALAQQGRLDEARAVERDVLAMAQRLKNPRLEGGARLYLSMIALQGGDAPLAEKEAGAAIEVLSGARPLRTVGLAMLARAQLAKNDIAAAKTTAADAFEELQALDGMEEGEALVRLVFAETLDASGDARGACDAARSARDTLLERAERISDEAWRESFLHRVPDHARTLALATRLRA